MWWIASKKAHTAEVLPWRSPWRWGLGRTVICHQQPRPLTCSVSSECSGTRSYEITSEVTVLGRDRCVLHIYRPIPHSHLPPTDPHRGPRPLTCSVSSECSGTRSYETTSRDQRGKIEMFFSSTGACTATKSPIVHHRSSIVAQLYFASVTQMFMMPLFVKVESDSSKLLRTVSKSGPNGCKERSKPQKILMRIKIKSFLGRQNLVLTVTHSH